MLFRASLKTLSLLYVLVLLLLWYLSPFLGARLGDWGRVVAPLLCLLLPAFLYVLIFRLNPNTYFRLARIRFLDLLWVLVLTLLVVLGIHYLLKLQAHWWPVPQSSPSYGAFHFKAPLAETLFQVFSLAIVPALVEEVFFRGLFLEELKKYLPKFWALLLSALAFSVAHGQWHFLLSFFLLGLYL
ncbi:MAG: CPBP family intramembrane metalloprotease, partial [Deltaproteobacteria bacterium]|nr:CPBP family intramembrane metalloprotease [Deltaproteobacteria bacterium]